MLPRPSARSSRPFVGRNIPLGHLITVPNRCIVSWVRGVLLAQNPQTVASFQLVKSCRCCHRDWLEMVSYNNRLRKIIWIWKWIGISISSSSLLYPQEMGEVAVVVTRSRHIFRIAKIFVACEKSTFSFLMTSYKFGITSKTVTTPSLPPDYAPPREA